MTVLSQNVVQQPWPFPSRPPEGPAEIKEPANDDVELVEVKKPEAMILLAASAGAVPLQPVKAKYPKYLHIRVCDTARDGDKKQHSIWPCGGYTIAFEVVPDVSLLRFGIAKCSLAENFNYIKARTVACRRLLRLKWKPRWKIDSNEMRDYLNHTNYFGEYDLGHKEFPREVIIDHMVKEVLKFDRDYRDFNLNPVQRAHYKMWGLI